MVTVRNDDTRNEEADIAEKGKDQCLIQLIFPFSLSLTGRLRFSFILFQCCQNHTADHRSDHNRCKIAKWIANRRKHEDSTVRSKMCIRDRLYRGNNDRMVKQYEKSSMRRAEMKEGQVFQQDEPERLEYR